MRRSYRPSLVTGPDGYVEQSFTANVVHVDDELVAFGELIPDPVRGLPHGTPVHSVLVHLSEAGPEMIEFNDQGNTVPVKALEQTVLAHDHVRFIFRRGAGPFAGRVSLAKEIEVFDDALSEPEDVQLSALCIRFEASDAQLDALRTRLAPHASDR